MIIAAAQIPARAGDLTYNAALHLQFARMAAGCRAQMVVFPELSLTGYELGLARTHAVRPDSGLLHDLRQLAAESAMSIVVGAPLHAPGPALHIGAIILQPDGNVATYRKVYVHASEQGVFAPGPGGADIRLPDASAALAICADASEPLHAAGAAQRGVALYAVGAMIEERAYARKSASLAEYARQHRMAVLLANYCGSTGGEVSAGGSAVWSEQGSVVVAARGGEAALVIASRENGAWRGKVKPVPSGL
ncbi:MAG: carbon-nitrogen hydrolase family protein [Bryobacterales bacterium]|nr:carbon-nitrogen hydrolase family protein [Bryobacterales bacterium]